MNTFDNSEFEAARSQYEKEAREKWGNTQAYAEYAGKSKGRSKQEQDGIFAGMDAILAEFSACMQSGAPAESEKAQQLAAKLQAFITENYYTCTKQILSGLGKMYVADERFTRNIDKHGPGTARYISLAIEIFCE